MPTVRRSRARVAPSLFGAAALLASSVAVDGMTTNPFAGANGFVRSAIEATGWAPGGVEAVRGIPARAWATLDLASGCWLDAHDADVERPVASLTKMLAAIVAADADLDTPVFVGPTATARDESQVGLRPGDLVTRRELLAATLVASGNDAARVLAADLAGDETTFVARMNATAAAMGLSRTRVSNVPGLDAPGQVSTAREVALLGARVLADPVLRPFVDDTAVTIAGRTFPTTNQLLGRYPGALGVKTGTTSGAGPSLVAAAERDGRTVVVAVLGARSRDDRFTAAATLLDRAFATAPACVPA